MQLHLFTQLMSKRNQDPNDIFRYTCQVESNTVFLVISILVMPSTNQTTLSIVKLSTRHNYIPSPCLFFSSSLPLSPPPLSLSLALSPSLYICIFESLSISVSLSLCLSLQPSLHVCLSLRPLPPANFFPNHVAAAFPVYDSRLGFSFRVFVMVRLGLG